MSKTIKSHKNATAIKTAAFSHFILKVLIAFKIAITETPTSAKIASHILLNPNTVITITASFTPIAKNLRLW